VSERISVIIHEVATDGLPDLSDDVLAGRVALVQGGVVVSGAPMLRGVGETRWEADPDVTSACPARAACSGALAFEGVTHWLEFPAPVWELAEG